MLILHKQMVLCTFPNYITAYNNTLRARILDNFHYLSNILFHLIKLLVKMLLAGIFTNPFPLSDSQIGLSLFSVSSKHFIQRVRNRLPTKCNHISNVILIAVTCSAMTYCRASATPRTKQYHSIYFLAILNTMISV